MSSNPISRLNTALSDRYAIERELGEGGMATVYLASDLKHNRKVALKVLKPELAAVVGAERFLAEIEVTANLQHPHILPLFDSGEADSFLFYVMPYVEGESLRERLDREKQLPVDEAVRITTDLAEALDYAHRQGIIHRDIKPANIMMREGRPLIADFGIALAVGAGGGRLTETGLSVGTPYYMSPEQATGDQAVGPGSDTYSLGCMLYEMLVGDPPYVGSTAQAVLGQIIAGEPVSATKKRASVPPNVDAAVRRALEKLPADRFGSAADFVAALKDRSFRHGHDPTLAGSAASVTAGRPWVTWFGWAAAAAFAALAFWPEAPSAPNRVTRVAIELPEAAGRFSTAVDLGSIDLTPDGNTLAFAKGSPETGQSAIWLLQLDQLNATEVPGTEGGDRPRFSTDGRRLAYHFGGRNGGVASLEGGPTLETEIGGDIAWESDNTMVAAVPNGTIVRVTPGSPARDTVFALEGASFAWPFALPDGPGVLVTRRYDGAAVEIGVIDFAADAYRRIMDGIRPMYIDGVLIAGDLEGNLFAASFDARTMEPTSEPIGVETGLASNGGSGTYYTAAQDGSLVYITGDLGRERLAWVSREGIEEELAAEDNDYGSVTVSPDGSRIGAHLGGTNDGDVYIIELDGRMVRLTLDGVSIRPRWTPGGEEITYLSLQDDSPGIFNQPADGSGERALLQSVASTNGGLDWSPDGTKLAYRNMREGSRDILVATPGAGGEPEPFLVSNAQERSPSISPDGRWIAYVSDRSDRPEVYVQPFPDGGATYAISTGGGITPLWSPSGGELFYVSPSQTMMSATIEVSGDGRLEILDRAELFSMASYETNPMYRPHDIAPDGRFLMIKRMSSEEERVVLVRNWLQGVKARLEEAAR